MFREAFESLTSSLSDRLVNPLTGSFLLSWPIWNYKFLMILFSDSKVQVKLSLISSLAYPSWGDAFGFGLLGPAVTALLYVFFYPYPSKWVIGYSLERKKELKLLRQGIDDQTPISLEESNQMKRKYNSGNKAHLDEIDALNELVRTLRSEAANSLSGTLSIESESRKLKVENEILEANHAEVSSRLEKVSLERETISKEYQRVSLELSAALGRVNGMAEEIQFGRDALADGRLKLSEYASENSQLKFTLENLTAEIDAAKEQAQIFNRYNSELEAVVREAKIFAESLGREEGLTHLALIRRSELIAVADKVLI